MIYWFAQVKKREKVKKKGATDFKTVIVLYSQSDQISYFFHFGATQKYPAFLKIRPGLIIILLDAFLTPAQAEQKH